jgi:hypothetical protein
MKRKRAEMVELNENRGRVELGWWKEFKRPDTFKVLKPLTSYQSSPRTTTRRNSAEVVLRTQVHIRYLTFYDLVTFTHLASQEAISD